MSPPNTPEHAKKGDGNLPSAIEFEPPLACVRRILKHSLPSSTNVGKDASAAFARASGIFIIYLTACANDFARENKRQTITANDVLAAIKVRRTHNQGSQNALPRFDARRHAGKVRLVHHFTHLRLIFPCLVLMFFRYNRSWISMSLLRKCWLF